MVLEILLILSIVLQIIAAAIAISLMKMTKYNLSWVLFTVALTAMAFLRLGEYLQLVGGKEINLSPHFFVWTATITSLCLAVGVFLVKKIFNHLYRENHRRKINEKRLLHTIIRTEEKERMRFSKDLHDGLGPLLSSAKMSLSALEKTEQTAENMAFIDNTKVVIEEAIHSLREISNNLSPHVLNDFGLGRGVKNFINKSTVASKINVKYTTNLDSERFDIDVEVILYRVICELINNSLKHSQCTEIRLDINHVNNIISIFYSDNGRGFSTSALLDVGMGLSNISSRIKSLKGSVDLVSEPEKGMSATISVDLKKQDSWRKNTK